MKIQSAFRMWLARKQVQQLRHEFYGPGMHGDFNGEDYDNMHVQVSFKCSTLVHTSYLLSVCTAGHA